MSFRRALLDIHVHMTTTISRSIVQQESNVVPIRKQNEYQAQRHMVFVSFGRYFATRIKYRRKHMGGTLMLKLTAVRSIMSMIHNTRHHVTGTQELVRGRCCSSKYACYSTFAWQNHMTQCLFHTQATARRLCTLKHRIFKICMVWSRHSTCSVLTLATGRDVTLDSHSEFVPVS